MAGRLVHFELPAQDTGRAREFYGSLFGWTFNSWDGPMEYHMTEAGGQPGGGIYLSDSGERGPKIYFDVEDVDAAAARVRELGGSADDPMPIPGVGRHSQCTDTEGNPFGLFESNESVGGGGGSA